MVQKVADSNPELGQLTTRKFPLNGYLCRSARVCATLKLSCAVCESIPPRGNWRINMSLGWVKMIMY